MKTKLLTIENICLLISTDTNYTLIGPKVKRTKIKKLSQKFSNENYIKQAVQNDTIEFNYTD